MIDLKMYKWSPSIQAAAAIYVAKKILKRSEAWHNQMAVSTGYEEKYVRGCAKEICRLLGEA
jgi:hypothetical protein